MTSQHPLRALPAERTLLRQCHPERSKGSAFLPHGQESPRQAHDRRRSPEPADTGESGYLLLALVVVMFLLALFLTIAAPTMARSLQRDKEVESAHRAQEYVRAIHNYYMKFNTYPASLDVLLTSNKQHFLRQQYKDPLTGGDYKLIHFGEAKTEVKGFFGEPLEGFAQGSLGSMAGSASGIGTGVGGAGSTSPGAGTSGSGISGSSTFGSTSFGSNNSGSGSGFSLGSSSFSSGSNSGQTTTQPTGAGNDAGSTSGGSAFGGSGSSASPSSTSSTGAFGGTSATQFQGSKGMIVGVGSNSSGPGQIEWNGSANIQDWEFLYDHRTWLIKQRVSIFGGSMGTSGSGGAFGSSNGSAFGSSGGGAFGGNSSGSGSNNGSSGTSSGFGGSSFGSGSSIGSGSGFGSGSSSNSSTGNFGNGSSSVTNSSTQPQ